MRDNQTNTLMYKWSKTCRQLALKKMGKFVCNLSLSSRCAFLLLICNGLTFARNLDRCDCHDEYVKGCGWSATQY